MGALRLVLDIDTLERISSTLRADLRPFPKNGATGRTLVSDICIRGRIESFIAGAAPMEDGLTANDIDGLEGFEDALRSRPAQQ